MSCPEKIPAKLTTSHLERAAELATTTSDFVFANLREVASDVCDVIYIPFELLCAFYTICLKRVRILRFLVKESDGDACKVNARFDMIERDLMGKLEIIDEQKQKIQEQFNLIFKYERANPEIMELEGKLKGLREIHQHTAQANKSLDLDLQTKSQEYEEILFDLGRARAKLQKESIRIECLETEKRGIGLELSKKNGEMKFLKDETNTQREELGSLHKRKENLEEKCTLLEEDNAKLIEEAERKSTAYYNNIEMLEAKVHALYPSNGSSTPRDANGSKGSARKKRVHLEKGAEKQDTPNGHAKISPQKSAQVEE